MKSRINLQFGTFLACMLPLYGFAHDGPVHEKITLHAAGSAEELSANYNNFVATIGGPVPLSVNGGPAKTPLLQTCQTGQS
jgi:hypothetical protein